LNTRIIACYLVAILALLVVGCSMVPATPTVGAPEADPQINILFIRQGEVKIKRAAWKNASPTSSGTLLQSGDQIIPGDDAQASILCADLTLWYVPQGMLSSLNNGCPETLGLHLERQGSFLGDTRVSTKNLLPYVISPRGTRILSPRPVLHWNMVPGAKSYTVRVEGENLEWQAESTDTQMVYPGYPILQPNTAYQLTVKADTGQSSAEEGVVGLGFRLVTAREAEEMDQKVKKIQHLDLPSPDQEYAIAQLFASQGLYAEAIQALEGQARSGSSTTHSSLMLGRLYLQTGLPLLAESHYLSAIQKAQQIRDLEVSIEAKARLAQISTLKGSQDEARTWINLAEQDCHESQETACLELIAQQKDTTQP
jgi:hypothetical protein